MAFEYKIISGAGEDPADEQTLNELGAEGWELVSVQLFNYESESEEEVDEDDEDFEPYVETVATYYLKRAK